MVFFEGLNLLILSFLGGIYCLVLWIFGLFKKFPETNKEYFLKKSKHRLPFFDFAKGVAILAVVALHACFFMEFIGVELSNVFHIWNEQMNRLMRFAIPIFFISSGALLSLESLNKKTLKAFYLEKARRILIPYIFFSILATPILLPEINSFFHYVFLNIKNIFTGGALLPYWFIPVLIQFYILYPFFWHLFVKKEIGPLKILLFSLVFSLASFFLISPKYGNWQLFFGDFYFFGQFLFLFILGMVLKSLVISEKRSWLKQSHFIIFGVCAVLVYFLLGLIAPLEKYCNTRLIYGPIIFLTLFYFYPGLSRFRISKLFEYLGKNSLYIYLMHFLVYIFIIPFLGLPGIGEISPFILFFIIIFINFLITLFLIRFFNRYSGLLTKELAYLFKKKK